MENLEDIELINRAREGDASAFECLAERHYLLVYKISYQWCGMKEDAEDITQEVFMKLARTVFSFKGESSFRTWLYRITINTAKDFTRMNERRRKKEMNYREQQKGNELTEQKDISMSEAVHQMITRLPQKLKETALLVFSEGMNHKEAAAILNCAEKTVSWRVFQIKKRLQSYLECEEVV